MPKTIHTIQSKNLTWLNITKAGEQEINYLKENFAFHHLDLKDCLPPLQRPKLVEHPDYLFMILLFPVYNRKTREIKPAEIDFFISKNNLVTVHNSELHPLMEIHQESKANTKFTEKFLSGNPTLLLYEILNRLLLYCFPILTHISNDIDEIEEKIFAGYEKKMVKEILLMKRNIVNFRKAMQAHKNVIKKLNSQAPQFFSTLKLKIYFANLVEYTKDIWDLLENFTETINALHQSNESLISFKLNTIMKTLTIFSVIVFPLTLLAAIFGMNTINMPLTQGPYDFWIILGMMLTGILGMLFVFKKKKWL